MRLTIKKLNSTTQRRRATECCMNKHINEKLVPLQQSEWGERQTTMLCIAGYVIPSTHEHLDKSIEMKKWQTEKSIKMTLQYNVVDAEMDDGHSL